MLKAILLTIRRIVTAQPIGMSVSMLKNKLLYKNKSGNSDIYHPFDIQFGTETGGAIAGSKLRSGSKADVYNFGYVGSQPSIIRKALAKIPRLEETHFIDLGCGKGRALMVAAEFPFRRIQGVELSAELCAIARKNIEKTELETKIEIVQGDAAEYQLPDGRLVIFIYNSFFLSLMKRIAAKITDHAD